MKYFIKTIFSIALLFVLTGCDDIIEVPTEPIDIVETPTPSVPNETVDGLYQYDLAIETFENFYAFSYDVYKNQYGYHVEVDITQQGEIEIENLDATIVIYVEYYVNNQRELFDYVIVIESHEENIHHVMPIDFLGNIKQVSLYYIEVESALGKVYSKQSVDITQKNYQLPPYQIGVSPIFIPNPEINQANYLAFLQDMETLDLENQYQFVVATEVKTKTQYYTYFETDTSVSTMKVDMLDFYIEQSFGQDKIVILENYNRLFMYFIDSNRMHLNRYLINPSVIADLSDLEDLISFDDEVTSPIENINPEIMKIEKNKGSYTVSALLKDTISHEEYDLIIKVYASLGVDVEIFERIIVTITYGMSDQSMLVHSQLTIPIYINHLQYVEIDTIEFYQFSPFEKIDFSDTTTYTIYPPDAIEEAVELSYPLEDISSTFHPVSGHFYYVELEKGQYLIEGDYQSVHIELYDQQGNPVVNNPLMPLYIYRYVFVETSGFYYMRVTSRSSATYSGYQFHLEKLPYDTFYTHSTPTLIGLGEIDVEIEGEHDFVNIIYKTNTPVLLKFSELKGGTILGLNYTHPYISGYSSEQLTQNRDLLIELPVGNNHIILRAQTAGSYQFHLEAMDISIDKSNVLETMREITQTFEGPDLFVSDLLGQAYLKLHVPEKSYISFKFQKYEGLSHPSIQVLNTQFEPVQYQSIYHEDQGIVLEAGSYVLKLGSNMASGGKIHYEMIKYEDLHWTIDIKAYPTISPSHEAFPFVMSQHFDVNHHNYFHFTLDQESIIFLQGMDYDIFTDTHERVTLLYHSFNASGTYVLLEAGSYYIKTHHRVGIGNKTYKLKLALITGELIDDNFNGSIVNEIGLGSHTFTKDNAFDQELVKIHIEVAKSYVINSNRGFYIYDESGRFISHNLSQANMYLEPGYYYIHINDYSYLTTWQLSIT